MSAGDPNCTYRAEDAKDGLQLFTNIVDGPLTLIVIVLGSIGNVHCVSVVCSRQLNRVMAANLAALAFWDLLLLVSAFGYYSLEAGVRLTGINMQFNRLTVSLHGLVAIANTASTWLVISVTTQRFRAVLQPFQCSNEDRLIGHHPQNFGRYHRKSAFRRSLCSMRIPMLVMLIALLVNLPTFFELRVRKCQSFDGSQMNITDAQEIYPTELRLNRKYQIYYRIAFNTLVKTFGPLIVIGALSVATLVGMHRAVSERGIILVQQRRPSVYRADTDKERCIQMVTLLLLIKFMALRCWPTVLDAWEVFGKPNSSKTGVILFKYLIKLSNLLVVTNSATNCLVYILVKRAFQRRQLRRLTLEQL